MREVPHVLRIFLLCVCGENERGREREREKQKTKNAEKSSLRNVRGSWHNESYTMSQQSIITESQTVDSSLARHPPRQPKPLNNQA